MSPLPHEAAQLELRAIGTTDLLVTTVGLGGNNFGRRLDLTESRRVVDAALDAGINFIDTADSYGGSGTPSIPRTSPSMAGDSERFLGQLLKGRRDKVVLATKVGNPLGDGAKARGTETYMRRALERSLNRLQIDCVDLLYYHRWDGITPLHETVGVLHEFVREGLVRSIGCSGLSADQLRLVGADIDVLQNHLNLLHREDLESVLPLCREMEVGYVPYFPLAGGLLSGKYRADAAPPQGSRLETHAAASEDLVRIEALRAFAAAREHSLLDLAIGWLACLPGVCSVIAGATSPVQINANAHAGCWRLGAADMDEVDGLLADRIKHQTS